MTTSHPLALPLILLLMIGLGFVAVAISKDAEASHRQTIEKHIERRNQLMAERDMFEASSNKYEDALKQIQFNYMTCSDRTYALWIEVNDHREALGMRPLGWEIN